MKSIDGQLSSKFRIVDNSAHQAGSFRAERFVADKRSDGNYTVRVEHLNYGQGQVIMTGLGRSLVEVTFDFFGMSEGSLNHDDAMAKILIFEERHPDIVPEELCKQAIHL